MPNSFTPQQIEEFLQEFFDVVGARQYVGARYVPIFGRAGEDTLEWDDTAPYEPLTVVMHEGVSYVSRRYVPTGIQLTDTDYWVETYRFNAQVEQYRQEVLGFQDQIDSLRNALEDDYVPFPDPDTYPKYGTLGQVLTTLADGGTKWEDPVVPSDAQAEAAVSQWLEDHPEATTTVQDNSLTNAKLIDDQIRDNKLYSKGILESHDALSLAVRYLLETMVNGYADFDYVQGSYNPQGILGPTDSQVTTPLIELHEGTVIHVKHIGSIRQVYVRGFTKAADDTLTRIVNEVKAVDFDYTVEEHGFYCIGYYNDSAITPADITTHENTLTVSGQTLATVFGTLLRSSETATLKTSESTDLDDYTSVGIYRVNATYDNVPDTTENGSLIVMGSEPTTRTMQIYAPYRRNDSSGIRPFVRLMGAGNSFGPWRGLAYIEELQRAQREVQIYYSSATQYLIVFGDYKMYLRHTVNASTDADNWNLQLIRTNDTSDVVVPDGTDIIGPLKLVGDTDFMSGVHGSSTTTVMGVYLDGNPVTLAEGLEAYGKCLTILMVDECRRADNAQHVFDRYVQVDVTRNNIHVTNTFKNVSGTTQYVDRATNGGLVAARNPIINSVSINNHISTAAPTTALNVKSHDNTEAIINTQYGTVTLRNIQGRESDAYAGYIQVFTSESPIRTKVYLDVIQANGDTGTAVADGELVAGAFEIGFNR